MESSPNSGRRGKLLIVFAILVTVILVGSVVYYYLHKSTPLSISDTETSTSVYSPGNGLQLILNLGNVTIKTGQSVSINFKVYNTINSVNTVNVERNYPIFASGEISSGPCSELPYGIAVLIGNFSANNFESGISLQIFEPGIYNCPMEFPITQYQFLAHSCTARAYSNLTSSPQGITETLNESLEISGYWTGNYQAHNFESFVPGIYTVVAADGWGQVDILHFLVKN